MFDLIAIKQCAAATAAMDGLMFTMLGGQGQVVLGFGLKQARGSWHCHAAG